MDFEILEDDDVKYTKGDNDAEKRKCKASDFAILLGAAVDQKGNSLYWASSFHGRKRVKFFNEKGKVRKGSVFRRDVAVRPAMSFSDICLLCPRATWAEEWESFESPFEYPQTVASKEISKELEEEWDFLERTGRTYTVDSFSSREGESDKKGFKPRALEEVKYNGKKYVKLQAFAFDNNSKITRDGKRERIKQGYYYFVEVENVTLLRVPSQEAVFATAGYALAEQSLFAGVQMNVKVDHKGVYPYDMDDFLQDYFTKDMQQSLSIEQRITVKTAEICDLKNYDAFNRLELKQYQAEHEHLETRRVIGRKLNKDEISYLSEVNKLIKLTEKIISLAEENAKLGVEGEKQKAEENKAALEEYKAKRKLVEARKGLSRAETVYLTDLKKRIAEVEDRLNYISEEIAKRVAEIESLQSSVASANSKIEKANIKLGTTTLSADLETEDGSSRLSRLERLNQDRTPINKRRKMTDSEIIKNWIDSGESVLLRGPSGIGKTERIRKQYPDLIYIKLTNNMFPEKVVGSMNLQTGQAIPPDFAKYAIMSGATAKEKEIIEKDIQKLYDFADEIYKRTKTAKSRVVILLDELLNVKPAVQSLVYTLVQNKMVEIGKGVKLPANTVVVATGNPKKYSSVAEDIVEPLEKRFDHILDMEPKVSEWIYEYAIPEKIHPSVIGYIFSKYQQNRKSEKISKIGYFYEEPEVGESQLDRFGCRGRTNDPRGWSAVSRCLYNFEENLQSGKYNGKDPSDILKRTLDTKLREEWSCDFFTFYNSPTLTVKEIVKAKYVTEDLPKNISEKFATIAGLLDATEFQVGSVRKFIKKHCGAEYLDVFDIYWAGNDNKRIEKLSEIQALSRGKKQKEGKTL